MTEAPFRFRHAVEVRFKDIDLGGHAHHAQALVYFEEARTAYWREIVGRGGVPSRPIDWLDRTLQNGSVGLLNAPQRRVTRDLTGSPLTCAGSDA